MAQYPYFFQLQPRADSIYPPLAVRCKCAVITESDHTIDLQLFDFSFFTFEPDLPAPLGMSLCEPAVSNVSESVREGLNPNPARASLAIPLVDFLVAVWSDQGV